MTAHLVFDLAEAEARHAFFYDESGNAVYASALIGHSKDDIGFSFAAVGDEDLGAVQDVFVTLQNSRGLLSGSIRTSGRFGQAESTNGAAFADRGQVFLFLFFRTEHVDRRCAQGNGSGKGDTRTIIDFGHFFNSQDVAENVHASSAVFFREADALEAIFDHFVDDLAVPNVVLVSFFNGRSQESFCKVSSLLLNHLLVFSQIKIHESFPLSPLF